MEELEPLIGAVIVLECDDWVFIPGELGGIATAEICEAGQVSGKQRS